MPHALIAGCGYVGSATARLLRANGWNVTAWTRSGRADASLGDAISTRSVDLGDSAQVRQNSFRCDLVVHCASTRGGDVDAYRAIYRDGVANLVNCFAPARVIFTSSTSVYPQQDGGWVDENSPAEPASAKGKILREAEEILLEHGGIVLRLGGIYGPGRSFLLQSLMQGSVPAAAPERHVNQIHRDDAASAILFLAQRADLRGAQIFNVVDDRPSPRGEILQWLSAQLRIPLRYYERATGQRRGDSNKRVSNVRLRSLGWEPRYPAYREGFTRSIFPAQLPLWQL